MQCLRCETQTCAVELSNQPRSTYLDQFLDGGDVEERDVVGSQSLHVLHLYQAPVMYLLHFVLFNISECVDSKI